MTKSIEKIHKQNSGKMSNKWSSYLPIYDNLFLSLADQPINLLEIGIQNGGSLDTWAKYFNNAACFIGCDIDEKCRNLKFDDERIHVVVGNANEQSSFDQIKNICSQFDIVIDDGSHKSIDILTSFLSYFPLLKPGGLFVIEDCHTLYWNDWGGGILNEFNGYYFFKKLIDVISYEFWHKELPLDVYLRTFFPLNGVPEFIQHGWIDGIEFRNSMIIIRKALKAGHEKLGERVITGTEGLVAKFDESRIYKG